MIGEFPPDGELVGFFEVEPAVLDPGVPWVYNTLTFETERDGIRIRCEICPGQLRLRLTLAGRDLLDADISQVCGLHLESRAGRAALYAAIDPRNARNDFVLQLKPRVHVAWSYGK